MTLLIPFGCIFLLSSLVWVPIGYWARGAIAREASETLKREIASMIDDVQDELERPALYSESVVVPFGGQVR